MEPTLAQDFLPFPPEVVAGHFLGSDELRRGLAAGFLKTVERWREIAAHEHGSLMGVTAGGAATYARQLEKDEPFWAAVALMTLYYTGDRIENFARLLRRGFGDKPPLSDVRAWDQLLLGELHLLFDAQLAPPREYREHLRTTVRDHSVVPYLLDAPAREGRRPLDGSATVDALLINVRTGFAVVFATRLLSDIACQGTFDSRRTDIARAIDLMLEEPKGPSPFLERREVSRTFLLLVTPKMLKEDPRARLYGWLWHDYREHPERLSADLHHRSLVNWRQVTTRMGWATWEDCAEIVPGACPWRERR